MTIETIPFPLPPSADSSKFRAFGREVKGVDPGALQATQFQEIEKLLYKHSALLFRNVELTPEQQYTLVKAFDPSCESYGHGNNKTGKTKESILHPYLKTIPRVPQVQLIGNGIVHDHEGIPEAQLEHASHRTFHKSQVSEEDETSGVTRFYRWHMDAALYNLPPPKVTALYGISVPEGDKQICRYDDGTGDELEVPLGTTAFVSGKTMFDILPPELKSLAVRSRVKYAPHPFIWMAPAHAKSTGLGIETEGLEAPLDNLPHWEKSKIQIYPVLWKNPITGDLHLQVHPCGACELFVDPLPRSEDGSPQGGLYPEGAHLVDLETVRDLIYDMQRPGIAPSLVYPHDWHEKDLMLFHNRGVMHSVVGHFKLGKPRISHQCNLAASDEPLGPSIQDILRWA